MTPKAAESEHAIREHLSNLLSSSSFAQVDRLKRFLRYVVEEMVAGRGERVKEYSIGVEVFDREPSFDPRTDPIVRVQARRLRSRLSRYYEEEGRHEEIRIELPKGSYAPVFHRRSRATPKHNIATALAGRNTISVLPFADRSPNGELGYFCEGICEEIVNALTKIPQVRIITPRKGDEVNAKQSATIISGSVRKSGNRTLALVELLVVNCASCSAASRRSARGPSHLRKPAERAWESRTKT